MDRQEGRSRQWNRVILLAWLLFTLVILFRPPLVHALDYKAQIQLGKQLFYDARLSKNKKISCATCHKPELAFTDGLTVARGLNGKTLKRNTPTLLHVADLYSFFWDGRASSLEAQVLEVIQNPDEMGMKLDDLVNRLNQIPGYTAQFMNIYGTRVTVRGITRSIAAYERTLMTQPSPFDKYLSGDKTAISPPAQKGLEIFQSKANCALCHHGFIFTDSEFHNIGVPSLSEQNSSRLFSRGKQRKLPKDDDIGRYKLTKRREDMGSFKTPTLRNITQTAPYMHNGVFKTLEEVIEFYDKGGVKNTNLDMQMKALGLTAQEKFHLIEFLKTLTGPLPDPSIPELP
jgi:cytochrome c peroxidase